MTLLAGLLVGVKVGAAYAMGSYGGGWIVAKMGPSAAANDAVRIGTKVGVGVASFAVLSLIV